MSGSPLETRPSGQRSLKARLGGRAPASRMTLGNHVSLHGQLRARQRNQGQRLAAYHRDQGQVRLQRGEATQVRSDHVWLTGNLDFGCQDHVHAPVCQSRGHGWVGKVSSSQQLFTLDLQVITSQADLNYSVNICDFLKCIFS